MKNLIRFILHYSFTIVFILLQVLSLWLIFNYTYFQQSSFFQSTNSISSAILMKVSSITDYLNLGDANQILIDENAKLKNKEDDSYVIVNKEYVLIEDTLRKTKFRYYSAKVINSTYHHVQNSLTLNKGKTGGLKPDMGVISQQGLVGVISATSDNFSIVLPIIHPKAWYSVQIKDKHYIGILKWDGKDFRTAQMAEVANHALLAIGDTVETRESGILPEGIPVGIIKKFEKVEGSNFLAISVELFVDFSQVYYVFVIDNLMKPEQKDLELSTEE